MAIEQFNNPPGYTDGDPVFLTMICPKCMTIYTGFGKTFADASAKAERLGWEIAETAPDHHTFHDHYGGFGRCPRCVKMGWIPSPELVRWQQRNIGGPT